MNRLSTICPHFGPCSGCTLDQQLEKPPIWNKVQEFLGHCSLVVGSLHHWRTKAKLAIRGHWKDPKIGLFRSNTHQVESIPDCLAHHPSINEAVKILKEAIQSEKISLYNEEEGILRYAQFFVELSTKKVQLALVVQSQNHMIDRLCAALRKSDLWHSIWLNIQPTKTNRILGDHWIPIFGKPFLWQTLGDQIFPFHPGAFSQAHWSLFEQLALQIVEWIPSGSNLLEIYAGVGILSILAAPKCSHVDLIENNLYSYLSFQEKQASLDYHWGDARLAIELLPGADCILVDPPRKGIDPLVVQSLQTFKGSLLYVSCDFQSFSRDVNLLRSTGWKLVDSKGYLFFPGTNQVEIAAYLQRE